MGATLRYPDQVQLAMKALASEARLAILARIIDEGEKTFTQLRKDHGLDASSLSNHLKALVEGSLLRNYYRKIPEDSTYSFYDATNFGKDFLTTLTDVAERYYSPTTREAASAETVGYMEREQFDWEEYVFQKLNRLSEQEFHSVLSTAPEALASRGSNRKRLEMELLHV